MRNIPYIHKPSIALKTAKTSSKGEDNTVRYNQLVHDLKSPVNSLKGIIEFAGTQIQDEQVKEYFYMMNQCVNKLEEKIMNTLSMFQDGRGSGDISPIDFESLLDDILVSLGHIDGFSEIKLTVEIDNAKVFYSSRAFLESIIQNLLENSIKYRTRDAEPEIKLVITDTVDGVKVEVSDNGIGIDEEQLPHIFDANFKSVMTDNGSNGLGLFIVKKAVEKMNGAIDVESAVGEGTTFTLQLPDTCSQHTQVDYVEQNAEEQLMYQ